VEVGRKGEEGGVDSGNTGLAVHGIMAGAFHLYSGLVRYGDLVKCIFRNEGL